MAKAIAVHEVGTYKTDCGCKRHYFRDFREVTEHLKACPKATTAFFCGHYQEPRVVARRGDVNS